jgi:hypothetical protein
LRCRVLAQVEKHFVDVTPSPTLRRIVALNHRMLGGVKMLGRVTVRGIVAATDMAACSTEAQVHPLSAQLQALLAAPSARLDHSDPI